jgi:hypothetical protein
LIDVNGYFFEIPQVVSPEKNELKLRNFKTRLFFKHSFVRNKKSMCEIQKNIEQSDGLFDRNLYIKIGMLRKGTSLMTLKIIAFLLATTLLIMDTFLVKETLKHSYQF